MRKSTFFAFLFILIVMLTIGVQAEAQSGYTVDKNGQQTNIKWNLTDDGALTFEIDSTATDKKASTVLSAKDPITLQNSAWDKALPTFSSATKVIIGEGITEIDGTFAKSKVKTVEIPKTLTSIAGNAFIMASELESIYIKGNTPEIGVADLSNVTKLGADAFVANGKLKTVILNPLLKGVIPFEFLKSTGVTSLEIPEGVTKLLNSSLAKSNALKTLTILGMNTELESMNVFKDNTSFPAIKAKKGSAAEAFAKNNGLTFIDIDSPEPPEETENTNPPPDDTEYIESPVTSESGYAVNKDGKQTNIKWTFSDNGQTLTFEIDKNAKGKIASTALIGKDPITMTSSAWNVALPTYSSAINVVIGEGITEISGIFANSKVKNVEIPKSLKTIGKDSFVMATQLESIYISGNTLKKGEADLSFITTLGADAFVSNGNLKSMKLNPLLTGVLPYEFIKKTGITELEIPEGVTKLVDTSLAKSDSLKVLTILGMNTELVSVNVFKDNTAFPSIKAKAGSKAEGFAKENGFTFIDLDTGAETKGTRPAPADTPPPSGGTTTPADPAPGIGLDAFNPEEATAYGYIGGEYYDTYWVYYQDTKTLKFFSNKTSGWNETGKIEKTDDKVGWSPYKAEIEYVEIGPYIHKVTAETFKDHTALKEVKLGRNISQIDINSFSGCTSLTTVWYDGGERVEGRCDLSKIKKVNAIITNTAIEEVLLSSSTAQIDATLGFKLKTILTPTITDELISFAKENGYNLQSTVDPNEKYEYYIERPDGVIMCGDRCGYIFDEATGTLTIYGSGATKDIVNYYGGGAKMQPWLDIKQQIKHIVITENITAIGKYSFTQCENLETVQLPNVESFVIENAAFEKCTNLKSIYKAGSEPIEGTFDLSNVYTLKAWTFAYDYLVANIILSPQITSIGTSTFEENISLNLANVYGTPGTYAETYAAENGLTFYDASTNIPKGITCEIPESTGNEGEASDSVTSDTEISSDSAENISVSDLNIKDEKTNFIFKIDGRLVSTEKNGIKPAVIIIVVVISIILTASVSSVIIIKKRKEVKK